MSLTDFGKPSRENFGYYELEKLENEFNSEDIGIFKYMVMDLVNSGIYSKLFDVFVNWKEPVPLLSDNSTEMVLESPLLILAYGNLQCTPKLFSSDLITINYFYYFFPFLEWVYSMNLGRQLTVDDVKKLFKSGIGEKIVFALENFDEINEIPEITPEFFQKVRKINWKDKKIKKLYSKLEKALSFLAFKKYKFKEGGFLGRQIQIVLFLAGCSAVNNEKDKIDENDVFTAYKTLFKIIKTDISKLINGTPKQEISHGYLVCQKCAGYYKLEKGESPDDFTSKCECGGKLEYKENL